MEMISNSAICDVLVNEEEFLAAARSAAIEGDQVFVAQAGKYFNLIDILFNSFVVVLVQALDCNFPPIFECA